MTRQDHDERLRDTGYTKMNNPEWKRPPNTPANAPNETSNRNLQWTQLQPSRRHSSTVEGDPVGYQRLVELYNHKGEDNWETNRASKMSWGRNITRHNRSVSRSYIVDDINISQGSIVGADGIRPRVTQESVISGIDDPQRRSNLYTSESLHQADSNQRDIAGIRRPMAEKISAWNRDSVSSTIKTNAPPESISNITNFREVLARKGGYKININSDTGPRYVSSARNPTKSGPELDKGRGKSIQNRAVSTRTGEGEQSVSAPTTGNLAVKRAMWAESRFLPKCITETEAMRIDHDVRRGAAKLPMMTDRTDRTSKTPVPELGGSPTPEESSNKKLNKCATLDDEVLARHGKLRTPRKRDNGLKSEDRYKDLAMYSDTNKTSTTARSRYKLDTARHVEHSSSPSSPTEYSSPKSLRKLPEDRDIEEETSNTSHTERSPCAGDRQGSGTTRTRRSRKISASAKLDSVFHDSPPPAKSKAVDRRSSTVAGTVDAIESLSRGKSTNRELVRNEDSPKSIDPKKRSNSTILEAEELLDQLARNGAYRMDAGDEKDKLKMDSEQAVLWRRQSTRKFMHVDMPNKGQLKEGVERFLNNNEDLTVEQLRALLLDQEKLYIQILKKEKRAHELTKEELEVVKTDYGDLVRTRQPTTRKDPSETNRVRTEILKAINIYCNTGSDKQVTDPVIKACIRSIFIHVSQIIIERRKEVIRRKMEERLTKERALLERRVNMEFAATVTALRDKNDLRGLSVDDIYELKKRIALEQAVSLNKVHAKDFYPIDEPCASTGDGRSRSSEEDNHIELLVAQCISALKSAKKHDRKLPKKTRITELHEACGVFMDLPAPSPPEEPEKPESTPQVLPKLDLENLPDYDDQEEADHHSLAGMDAVNESIISTISDVSTPTSADSRYLMNKGTTTDRSTVAQRAAHWMDVQRNLRQAQMMSSAVHRISPTMPTTRPSSDKVTVGEWTLEDIDQTVSEAKQMGASTEIRKRTCVSVMKITKLDRSNKLISKINEKWRGKIHVQSLKDVIIKTLDDINELKLKKATTPKRDALKRVDTIADAPMLLKSKAIAKAQFKCPPWLPKCPAGPKHAPNLEPIRYITWAILKTDQCLGSIWEVLLLEDRSLTPASLVYSKQQTITATQATNDDDVPNMKRQRFYWEIPVTTGPFVLAKFELDVVEMTALFFREKKDKKITATKKKRENITLLTPKRFQAVQIALRALGINELSDLGKLKSLVCDLNIDDSESLSVENLKVLESIHPNDEESTLLSVATYADLQFCETVMLEIERIDNFKNRARFIINMSDYKDAITKAKIDQHKVHKLTAWLLTSLDRGLLRSMLAFMLKASNFINSGHQKYGNSRGVRVSLSVLRTLMTKDRSMNFLQYLVYCMDHQYPTCWVDFEYIQTMDYRLVTKIDPNELLTLIQDWSSTVRSMASDLEVSPDLYEAKFHSIIGGFCKSSRNELNNLIESTSCLIKQFNTFPMLLGDESEPMTIIRDLCGIITEVLQVRKVVRVSVAKEMRARAGRIRIAYSNMKKIGAPWEQFKKIISANYVQCSYFNTAPTYTYTYEMLHLEFKRRGLYEALEYWNNVREQEKDEHMEREFKKWKEERDKAMRKLPKKASSTGKKGISGGIGDLLAKKFGLALGPKSAELERIWSGKGAVKGVPPGPPPGKTDMKMPDWAGKRCVYTKKTVDKEVKKAKPPLGSLAAMMAAKLGKTINKEKPEAPRKWSGLGAIKGIPPGPPPGIEQMSMPSWANKRSYYNK